MSETSERAKELLKQAETADQTEVTISVADLQALVDQAEIHSGATTIEQLRDMDAAIERWAEGSQRQVGAINRLIEQNRILQRRAAAANTAGQEKTAQS